MSKQSGNGCEALTTGRVYFQPIHDVVGIITRVHNATGHFMQHIRGPAYRVDRHPMTWRASSSTFKPPLLKLVGIL
jgi:hypothetical protein